ncbi:DNA polymerase epsilon subunit 4-like [Gigantopelta aegis]|uniref:DNA polymerase epsilon subunit 4-like n=1 Tax=Gigantopelta aegis TaxID=1735272 RepID=UPI001B887FB4|nr:DNA polymerase epsilon subunit 4-like [Gigantopelta aegis]
MAGEEKTSTKSSLNQDENKADSDETSQSQGADQAPVCDKLIKLPLTRVKHIIKTDPDVTLASSEAVVTLAKAAELFIQALSKDAVSKTMTGKRKTIQRKDLDIVMDTRDCYAFLEGAIDT